MLSASGRKFAEKRADIPQEIFKFLGVFIISTLAPYDLNKLAKVRVCVRARKTAT